MSGKKSDDIMDIIENFGEVIGRKINKKGSWIIKALIMAGAVIFIGGGIVAFTIIKKSVGEKK